MTSNTIAVHAEVQASFPPDFALVHITARDAYFFSGRAALDQSKLINGLIDRITELKIPESAVSLDSMTAETAGRKIKSSVAIYELTITVQDLDLLPQVLHIVVTSDIQLNEVVFRYDEEQVERQWMAKACALARAKAESAVQAMGARLGPVLSITEAAPARHPEPRPQFKENDMRMTAHSHEFTAKHTVRRTFAVHATFAIHNE